MAGRYDLVIYDYTVNDLRRFETRQARKTPAPMRPPVRRKKAKPAPAPEPAPRVCQIYVRVGRGYFGGSAMVSSPLAACRYTSHAAAWEAFDAWLEGEYPGARRPVTARLIERWEVAS